MPLKKLIQNPILAVGILMMFIFLSTYGPKLGLWEARSDKLRPTSCKAVIVKLVKRVPANWSVFCEGKTKDNLAIKIKSSHTDIKDINKLRSILYRQLANDLISTAKTAPSDNLEKTPYVRFLVEHPIMNLNALTQGQYLVKLSTLRDSKLIAEHLKVTVNIQETVK
jgi:hypothetical protein